MAADFSERLRGVFALILTPPDELGLRRPYTTAELAEVIRLRNEEGRDPRTVSKARLDQLRNKRGNNPTVDVMRTIAGAFAELARRSMPPEAQADSSSTDAILWCLVSDDSVVNALAARVLDAARSHVGKPYRRGGVGPDAFDAAGLTHAAWRTVDVSLPTDPATQAAYGEPIPLSLAQPADLLFFSSDGTTAGINHVALYLGGGQILEADPDAGVHQCTITPHPDATTGRGGHGRPLDFSRRVNRADAVLDQFSSMSARRDSQLLGSADSEVIGVMGRYLDLQTDEARQAVRDFIAAEAKREGLLGRISRRNKD